DAHDPDLAPVTGEAIQPADHRPARSAGGGKKHEREPGDCRAARAVRSGDDVHEAARKRNVLEPRPELRTLCQLERHGIGKPARERSDVAGERKEEDAKKAEEAADQKEGDDPGAAHAPLSGAT